MQDNVSYLVENGIIATTKPLLALGAGLHFWVIKGIWHSEEPQSVITQGAIILNEETVIRIDGPVCLFCDLDYGSVETDKIVSLSKCRGVNAGVR